MRVIVRYAPAVVAAAVCFVAFPQHALAVEPGQAGNEQTEGAQVTIDSGPAPAGISVGGLIGYGFEDAHRFGVGARAGYTLRNHLYVGGNFMWFAGSETDDVTEKVWTIGGEVGFALNAGPIVVRPYVGLGALMYNTDGERVENGVSVSADSRDTYLYVQPGAVAQYFVTRNVFVGADVSYQVAIGEQLGSLNLMGTAGVYF